jgi:hypothetical protein
MMHKNEVPRELKYSQFPIYFMVDNNKIQPFLMALSDKYYSFFSAGGFNPGP